MSSNTSSTSTPALKHVKKSDFIHPEDVNLVADEDEATVIEKTVEVSKDVSDIEFTIQKCLLLDVTSVMENADFIKLGEFRYREFQTISIRKVTKKADELGVRFEWDYGQAVISHRGIRLADVLKFDVEEDSDWRKVEKGIERWLQENKKDVKVKLTVCYKTVGETIHDTLKKVNSVAKKVYMS
jgi:hypothetical protein